MFAAGDDTRNGPRAARGRSCRSLARAGKLSDLLPLEFRAGSRRYSVRASRAAKAPTLELMPKERLTAWGVISSVRRQSEPHVRRHREHRAEPSRTGGEI